MLDQFSTSHCYCYLFHQLVLPFCENCASLLLCLYWITIPAFNFFLFSISLLEEWLSAVHVIIEKLTFGVKWLDSLSWHSSELSIEAWSSLCCYLHFYFIICYLHFLLPSLYYCVLYCQTNVVVTVHPDLTVPALICLKALLLAHW